MLRCCGRARLARGRLKSPAAATTGSGTQQTAPAKPLWTVVGRRPCRGSGVFVGWSTTVTPGGELVCLGPPLQTPTLSHTAPPPLLRPNACLSRGGGERPSGRPQCLAPRGGVRRRLVRRFFQNPPSLPEDCKDCETEGEGSHTQKCAPCSEEELKLKVVCFARPAVRCAVRCCQIASPPPPPGLLEREGHAGTKGGKVAGPGCT